MHENSVETSKYRTFDMNRTSFGSVFSDKAPSTLKPEAFSPSRMEIGNDKVKITNEARIMEGAMDKAEGSIKFQKELSLVANKQVVIKLIDPKTKDVVRQIPPEDLMRLQEAIRNAAKNI